LHVASDRPTLEDGEYHVLDLLGLSVFDRQTGEYVGKVVDIIPSGNDLLEVETPSEKQQKRKRVLIPFVEEIVPIVDLDNCRVEILPPAGLLEL